MACLSCQVYWKTRRLIQELFFACAWKSWLQIPPTVKGHYFSISFIALCRDFISLTLYAVAHFKTVITVIEKKKSPVKQAKVLILFLMLQAKLPFTKKGVRFHYSP